MQSLNILFIYWTLVVLNFSSKDIKWEHPSNIDSISVTFDVSKLSRFIYVNPVHPLNIDHIISTFDVSKLVKRKEDNFSQFSNIPLRLVVK